MGGKQSVMSSMTNRREEAEHKEMSHQTELLIQACDSPALWCKVTYIVVSHECVLFILHTPSFFSSVSISLCPAALAHYHNGVGNDEALIPFVSNPSPSPTLTGLTLNNTKKRDSFFLLSVSGKYREA